MPDSNLFAPQDGWISIDTIDESTDVPPPAPEERTPMGTYTLDGYIVKKTTQTRASVIATLDLDGTPFYLPDTVEFWNHPLFLQQVVEREFQYHTLGDLTNFVNHLLDSPDITPDLTEWLRIRLLDYHHSNSFSSVDGKFLCSDPTRRWFTIRTSRVAVLDFVLLPEPEQGEPQVYSIWNWSSGSIRLETDQEDVRGGDLHNYDYIPAFQFHGNGAHFGVELEVNTKLSPEEMMKIIEEVEPKQPDVFYLKHDGSIRGGYQHAYEIVTQPMTMGYHKKHWGTLFKKLTQLAKSKDLELNDVFDFSHSTTANGLHVHVSRSAFFTNRGSKALVGRHRVRTSHANRFMSAFNLWDSTSQRFLQKMSGRTISIRDSEYFHISPSFDGKTLARRLKEGDCTGDRRVSCRATSQTYEVRIFAGIPDFKHIIKSLEFVDSMREYTRFASLKTFNHRFAGGYEAWLINQPRHTAVKRALK